MQGHPSHNPEGAGRRAQPGGQRRAAQAAPIDDPLQPPAHGLSLLPHTEREPHES